MNTVTLDRLHDAIAENSGGERVIPLPPFSPENLRIARVPRDRTWPIVRIMSERIGPFDSVVFAAPSIWQLEPMVFNASRSLGIPLGAGPAYNPPVVLEMARQLSRALVVLDIAQAHEYVEALRQLPPPAHIVWVGHAVRGIVRAPATLPCESSGVTELLPGFPILYECPHADRGIHAVDEYELDISEKHALIAPTNEAFLTAKIELPYELRELGVCCCGSQTYEIVS